MYLQDEYYMHCKTVVLVFSLSDSMISKVKLALGVSVRSKHVRW